MAQQVNDPVSFTTGEALEAFRRVKMSGNTVIYADAGDRAFGVNQAYTASGGQAQIRRYSQGTCKVTAAGAFSAGDLLYPAADGKVDDVVTGFPEGRAREAATADGDIIEMVPMLGNVEDSARSRTAAQMPTAAILANFDLAALRTNPMAGSLLFTDFTHGNCLPDVSFVDATYAASAGGKTPTEHIYLGVTAIGELIFFTTTDNQAAEGQWACPIKVSGGTAWAFGVRIKQVNLTDTKCGWFAGLMLAQKLVGDLIVDGGTLQTEGSLGFQKKEGDGDKYDLVFDETGQTQNEWDDDWCTPVADTYNTLELYCNGTTITPYLDGVASGTVISAAAIAGADFPGGKIFVPTIALKAAHADDFSVTLDWMYAIQHAA